MREPSNERDGTTQVDEEEASQWLAAVEEGQARLERRFDEAERVRASTQVVVLRALVSLLTEERERERAAAAHRRDGANAGVPTLVMAERRVDEAAVEVEVERLRRAGRRVSAAALRAAERAHEEALSALHQWWQR